jgi:hypothetical protein
LIRGREPIVVESVCVEGKAEKFDLTLGGADFRIAYVLKDCGRDYRGERCDNRNYYDEFNQGKASSRARGCLVLRPQEHVSPPPPW